jgi:hypothetical protein
MRLFGPSRRSIVVRWLLRAKFAGATLLVAAGYAARPAAATVFANRGRSAVVQSRAPHWRVERSPMDNQADGSAGIRDRHRPTPKRSRRPRLQATPSETLLCATFVAAARESGPRSRRAVVVFSSHRTSAFAPSAACADPISLVSIRKRVAKHSKARYKHPGSSQRAEARSAQRGSSEDPTPSSKNN